MCLSIQFLKKSVTFSSYISLLIAIGTSVLGIYGAVKFNSDYKNLAVANI